MSNDAAFDLGSTFVHLSREGSLEPIRPTASFWSSGSAYHRVIAAFDFSSPADLHASMQEVHPEADELVVVLSGAIDLVIQEGDEETRVSLDAGQAAIVPRGAWHRLVMREPGRLLFVNSRAGMQTRHAEHSG